MTLVKSKQDWKRPIFGPFLLFSQGIKSINLRSITLDKLKEKVIAGDSKAIELALANQELEPDFIIDRVSSKHLEKRIEQEILYRLDPRQKKIDWPGDNEAPF